VAVPGPNGSTILDDTYNASPASTIAALNLLAELGGRKIAVLGDMLEMGDFSVEAHQQIGEKVGELSIDFLLALGEEAPVLVESAIRHGLALERASSKEMNFAFTSSAREVVRVVHIPSFHSRSVNGRL
jgi:UDP-N-acetylmuramoyl-tripeptide--D-alanyl-D-alanine ligase